MLKNRKQIVEFIRFCVVGGIATAVHYGIYYLLQIKIDVNVAYTGGYLVSLVCNFFLTSYLTFRRSPSTKRALGFGASHLVNYLLHMLLFNAFLYFGVSKEFAPVPVLVVVVPINFLLLRWVFTHQSTQPTKG